MSLKKNTNDLREVISSLRSKVDGIYDAGQDAMWDCIQNYGNRTDYRSCFFISGFSHIDPKWPVRASNSDSIFGNANKLETVNWEKFDLTATSSLYNAFGFCYLLTEVDTDLAVVNGTATLLNSIFRNCYKLQRVKKLTAFPSAVWKNSFDECRELTHIIFDGEIGANGLNLQWSTKLDKESIESIINALSTTTSDLSVTLSETAVNQAFGYEEILDDSPNWVDGIYSPEWVALVDSKPNWTITLV